MTPWRPTPPNSGSRGTARPSGARACATPVGPTSPSRPRVRSNGAYEGLTRAQIREQVPDWSPWTHPMPGGETLAEVARRACAVLDHVRAEPGKGGKARVLL